jgi:hypothetical protein
MAEPAKIIASQRLQVPTQTFYLRAADPSLDAALASKYGGLDNRFYDTGDILVHDGTKFVKVSVENIGDILITDSTKSVGVKWSSQLTQNINDINTLNVQKTNMQNNIDTLNTESTSINDLINLIIFDKQQIQNKINALYLVVQDQSTEINNLDILLDNLQTDTDNSNVTLNDIQSGIAAIDLRVSNVENQYLTNVNTINSINNTITITQTNVSNLSVTSTATTNKIINGNFTIWQRGDTFGPAINTKNYLTADRWHHSTGHGGQLTSSKVLVDTTTEGIVNGLLINLTGNTSQFTLSQFIENVYSIRAGQVTISIFLIANSNCNIGLTILQNFGSGGDPDITVSTTTFAVTTTITKFIYTFTMPSVLSKNIGSNSYVKIMLSGSTWDNIIMSRFQVQESNTAMDFEERSYNFDLDLCQRYYETGYDTFNGYASSNQEITIAHQYNIEKRIIPTVTVSNSSQSNFSIINGIGALNNKISGSTTRIKSNQNGYGSFINLYTADAEFY